jgi:hypothetical protein
VLETGKVLRRAQKLRALAIDQAGTPEGDTAARLLAELLQRHTEPRVPGQVVTLPGTFDGLFVHRLSLLLVLAEAHGVLAREGLSLEGGHDLDQVVAIFARFRSVIECEASSYVSQAANRYGKHKRKGKAAFKAWCRSIGSRGGDNFTQLWNAFYASATLGVADRYGLRQKLRVVEEGLKLGDEADQQSHTAELIDEILVELAEGRDGAHFVESAYLLGRNLIL